MSLMSKRTGGPLRKIWLALERLQKAVREQDKEIAKLNRLRAILEGQVVLNKQSLQDYIEKGSKSG